MYRRAASISNITDQKNELTDQSVSMHTTSPDKPLIVTLDNQNLPLNQTDHLDPFKPKAIELNLEANKHLEEIQKKRKEDKKLIQEQAQRDKEFVLKQMSIKPIQEKLDESKEESLSVEKEEVVKPSSPEPRNDLKDINQFDFSKLVAPKKPTIYKQPDTSVNMRVLPKFK